MTCFLLIIKACLTKFSDREGHQVLNLEFGVLHLLSLDHQDQGFWSESVSDLSLGSSKGSKKC